MSTCIDPAEVELFHSREPGDLWGYSIEAGVLYYVIPRFREVRRVYPLRPQRSLWGELMYLFKGAFW